MSDLANTATDAYHATQQVKKACRAHSLAVRRML